MPEGPSPRERRPGPAPGSARAFTDPESVLAMEAEHLPLWRAYLRAASPLAFPGVRVMDFGCNRGGLLLLIGREGFPVGAEGRAGGGDAIFPSFGVGVDLNTPATRALLEQAAEAARAAGGTVPLFFTTSSPQMFPGQFDLVLSHEVVYLLPELRPVFEGIRAALGPEGRFCFTTGCHTENPLAPLWMASFRSLGIDAQEYSTEDYESALRDAGFLDLQRGRVRLTPGEYDAWVAERASGPNPDWFPSAEAERSYYTQTGKLWITARRG